VAQEETERHWRKAVEQGLKVFPFSDLRLLRMIGRGGVGKVFETQHVSSGRTVAVKFLHRRFQNDSEAVHRLLNEADTVRKLKHQGVVRWLGIGRTFGGVIFLVMDFVTGQSLDKITEPLRVSEVVSIGSSLAQTLRYIHQQGVVHCDLKPSNVIIRADGTLVLADFGLARSVVPHDADLHGIAGTAPWMAPEQIDAHFGPLTAQTDVYGFGALMYSLLCGRPPYDGARSADIFTKIIGGQSYPPIRSLKPETPDGLQRLIADCLNREAQCRPASFADVAERLQELTSD
jgi:serine/threonine-protein kinase